MSLLLYPSEMNNCNFHNRLVTEWINSCVSVLSTFDRNINTLDLSKILRVFVHRSVQRLPANEKLEFVGDSVIKAIATAFAMSMILNSVKIEEEQNSLKRKRRIHYEDEMNVIRQRLIGNEVMKSICLRLGW